MIAPGTRLGPYAITAVMLTKSGAKLLDFGLAKTGAHAVAGSLSMLPTTPPGLTVHGTILGTFQYMAP